jgi:hypothetical protein
LHEEGGAKDVDEKRDASCPPSVCVRAAAGIGTLSLMLCWFCLLPGVLRADSAAACKHRFRPQTSMARLLPALESLARCQPLPATPSTATTAGGTWDLLTIQARTASRQ